VGYITAALQTGLGYIRSSPCNHGRLELIVRRPAEDEREVLAEADLDCIEGLVGDSWKARGNERTEDGSADSDKQLTVISVRLAGLVAGLPERRQLAGDQLYVDLDLSEDNVPAGTRLALGSAVIEVTEPPHLGCSKFAERFGPEAMRFVNSPVGRQLRLRGANARVVVAGSVRQGDTIERLPESSR
jgi:hypothetical protein